jgi:hypothetical protein
VGVALAADELEELAEAAARAAAAATAAVPAPAAPQDALPITRPAGIPAEPARIVTPANGTAATTWPASGSAGWS